MKNGKVGLILTGGTIELDTLQDFVATHDIMWVIAVDKGLMSADAISLPVDVIIGDFDSVNEIILYRYQNGLTGNAPEIITLQPEKDMTDTEVAIEHAIKLLGEEEGEIVILGATGTRIDHVLANIHLLMMPLEANVQACILDKYNKIYLKKNDFTVKIEDMYGKYLSLLPLTERVKGVTLKGFKYPLEQYTLVHGNSLGISNEVVEKEAFVSIHSGILIAIESRD